ncbi:MAG: 16S rRNA (cytosine(1402)-N(4))-methyltransferase RsmH, partial [Anaerolineaceae bacterium]|nr:16S rRNA (cytosine(1402)-N(4))-methyltransferase RsmH [Anaerolineaceae bacterium]
LERSGPGGKLLGMDLDPQALALASQRLSVFEGRFVLRQASYTSLSAQLRQLDWEAVQGIVFDLGVSSMQVDTPERGFSFMSAGPLDMRFGPQVEHTAGELVNRWSETELADLIWRYGEEPLSRRIARVIVHNRPIHTTQQLADLIEKAAGKQRGRHHHPATKTFQALRIGVNQELQAIEEALPQAVDALASGGRLAVISFHSLEDRLVKQYFRQESRDCICPPGQPVCTCGHKAQLTELTRRPVFPSEAEVAGNARSRSARLRVVEKLA